MIRRQAGRKTTWAACLLLAWAGTGCLSMKSEHEVKPIHITMDINLKVDRELDRYFGEPGTEERQ